MKKITFESEHRRKHFDFFRQMDQPHTGVCLKVDITDFLAHVRASPDWRFTPAMVYLLSRTANDLPHFRWRIRGDEVVEHDAVHPSFAVPTKVADVFSFCTVPYETSPRGFHGKAVQIMEDMQEQPSFEDEAGRDDFLFMSAFPWASFTAVMHPMHYNPADSVPRIVWGKYEPDFRGRMMMPLALQAHHSIVDGSDFGAFYRRVSSLLEDAEKIFS